MISYGKLLLPEQWKVRAMAEVEAVEVIRFSPNLAQEIALLLREMEAFYGTEIEEGTNVEADLCRHAEKGLGILVATYNQRVAGVAFFDLLYPGAGLVTLLHLKQLYVANAARRLGIGRVLLRHVAHVAKEQGCARIEWTTGFDNRAARALYEGIGAMGSEKMKYVLQGCALDQLARAEI